MGLYDGSTNRKSQAHASSAHDASSVEFRKDAPLVAFGAPGASIANFEDDGVPTRLSHQLYRSRFGRVLIRILKEVHQKLPHQNVVHVNQRQIFRESNFNWTIPKLALHPLEH